MKASEILLELGDASYPYKSAGVKGHFVATTDRGDKLRVIIDNQQGIINIGFWVNMKVALSNRGDQFKILATVANVIRNELPGEAATADIVTFSADSDEPSRVRLYDRRVVPMINKLLGPDWQFYTDDLGGKVYIWSRKSDES